MDPKVSKITPRDTNKAPKTHEMGPRCSLRVPSMNPKGPKSEPKGSRVSQWPPRAHKMIEKCRCILRKLPPKEKTLENIPEDTKSDQGKAQLPGKMR